MLFPRLSIAFFYAIFACSFLAAAMPGGTKPPTNTPTVTITVTAPGPTVTAGGQCSTGPIQCCNSVQKADSPAATTLLGLLGIVLTDLTVAVGLGCSPISVIGVGGGSCSATTVCCEDNAVGGLISIGCIPIIL